MSRLLRRAALMLALAALAACNSAPDATPAEPLATVAGWPQWPAGKVVGQVTAVDVDKDNHVFVLHRPGRDWPAGDFPKDPIEADTVTVFDGQSGKMIDAWGAGQMVMPHGISIADDGSVWITDAGREQILHYTPDGTLIGTIGTEGETGDDATHFGRATDVAFDDGDILVADGYLNARIARFRPDGRFISQFGEAGDGEGQFHLPHSVEVDGDDILVSDRENMRFVIMDRAGGVRLTRDFNPVFHPYAAKRMKNGDVLLAEGRDGADRGYARLVHMDGKSGNLTFFDLASGDSGQHRAHDLAIGPDGAIYVADVMGDRIYKVAPGVLDKAMQQAKAASARMNTDDKEPN